MQVVAGQTAALALKKVKRSAVRKGMVLLDERLHPKASWEFDADIAILTHSTTIQPRYQVRCSGRFNAVRFTERQRCIGLLALYHVSTMAANYAQAVLAIRNL